MSSHSTAYYTAVSSRRFGLVGKQWHKVPDVGRGGADCVLIHTKLGGCRACVFSLLKLFFGDDRDSSLSDMIQATLMLKSTISVSPGTQNGCCACVRLPGSAQIAVVDGQDFPQISCTQVKFAGACPVV